MYSNFPKAYVEVLEILKNIPKEDYEKIPESMIQFFEENKDTSYKYCFDKQKDIEDQNLLRETKSILVTLYRDYFLEPDKQCLIDDILNINEKKYQEELREKYNPDNIFNNN